MNISSLYEEVHDLLEVRSKHDDQSEPYKSKYNARKILEIMKGIISNEIDKEAFISEDTLTALQSRLACIYLILGIVGIETEELSTGQEHLEKVLEHLKNKECFCNSIIVMSICLNNLAILWAQRDDQEKAFKFLNTADKLYKDYKKQEEAPVPLAIAEIFECQNSSSTGWDALEKNYTLTQYYLAQVVGKLGRSNESSFLLLTTLQRQLSAGDFEPITWAANASNLSKFFQTSRKFKLSRRVLAASWTVIQSPEAQPREATEDFTLEELEEKYREIRSDICHIWGQYCLNLLQVSYNISEDSSQLQDLESAALEEEKSLQEMQFSTLEISNYEEEFPHEIAKDYEEAKLLFMSGLRMLTDARSFFTLEDHASTHAEITQEMSTLYKLLASFDLSPDRQSKMHKRRIDLLSPLVKELNSQYYLQVCLQLDYELGETYSAMVDCKYQCLTSDFPNLQQRTKINSLVQSSINHFESFLKKFETPSDEKKKYPKDNERPILVAFFHIGRMWSKMIDPDPQQRINFIANSIKNYKTLVDYCDENPESAELMSLELPVCREMISLLPLKMDRIRNEIRT